jgi:hypothetical protein
MGCASRGTVKSVFQCVKSLRSLKSLIKYERGSEEVKSHHLVLPSL